MAIDRSGSRPSVSVIRRPDSPRRAQVRLGRYVDERTVSRRVACSNVAGEAVLRPQRGLPVVERKMRVAAHVSDTRL